MVAHFDKVKNFLFDLGFELQSEDAAEGLVVITDEDRGISHLILDCEEDILILEQYVFDLKDDSDASTLKYLLQINRSLVHGALVLNDENKVIFRDTLQLENMDKNELESSINAIGLMMAEYAEDFIKFAS
ncbi:YbjN domain-containing protein [Tunicatimonas pelagia]|uniref:YbjN domain-containing protein n=1 Tax=Tunicatimonas pelagia TaxID=931531 RepID=UPI002665107A|nr:YbjN domain-containing protein [Tunicatimonas pelagia]WKN45921.1 YbjN domain-containing protein [Tunicatimonas pelagia]